MTLYWKVSVTIVLGSWLLAIIGAFFAEVCCERGEEWLKLWFSIGLTLAFPLAIVGLLLMLW